MIADANDLSKDDADRLREPSGIKPRGDDERSGVGVRIRARTDRIRKTAAFSYRDEETRAHGSSENIREEGERVRARIFRTECGNAEGEVCLRGVLGMDMHHRTARGGGERAGTNGRMAFPRGQLSEGRIYTITDMLADVSRDGEDELVGVVEAISERHERRTRDAEHRLSRSADQSSERVSAIEQLFENIVEVHGGVVLVEMDFLEDHFPFTLEFHLRKGGMKEHVLEYIQREIEVLGVHLDVVAGVVLSRECIVLCAHAVEVTRNMERSWSPGCSLEHEVLNEVRRPIERERLVARSHRNIREHRDCLRVVRGREEDTRAVRELVRSEHTRDAGKRKQMEDPTLWSVPRPARLDNVRGLCYDRREEMTFTTTNVSWMEEALGKDTRRKPTDTTDPYEVRHAALLGMIVGSAAIPMQEAVGQRSFVASDTLPTRIGHLCDRESEDSKRMLGAAGVKFLGVVEGDDLFQYVELPTGWKRVAANGADYWSYLVDDRGRTRARIFYKAAVYDRRAAMHLSTRFHVRPDYDRQDKDGVAVAQVTDGEAVIHATEAITLPERGTSEYYEVCHRAERSARTWLQERYPNWNDPSAYWD